MLALSNNTERGEVLYERLYVVLDKQPRDDGRDEQVRVCVSASLRLCVSVCVSLYLSLSLSLPLSH